MSGYASTNPATREVVAEFDTISDADVGVSMEPLHAAYVTWRRAELVGRTGLPRIADASVSAPRSSPG